MNWPRFWWGLVGGGAAGGITYATEPVRPWWPVVAIVVFALIWRGEYVDD